MQINSVHCVSLYRAIHNNTQFKYIQALVKFNTGNSLSSLYFHSQLSQVLRPKQVDSSEVKQVSVRRFATFDLFTRKRLVTQDSSDTTDDQWVEYRSVYFPECSALLRYTQTYITITHVKTSKRGQHRLVLWMMMPRLKKAAFQSPLKQSANHLPA